MENLSVVLCDPDEVYIRKLAAVLRANLEPGVFIRTSADAAEHAGDSVTIRMFSHSDGGAETLLWETEVYKYQSAALIAGQIRNRIPTDHRQTAAVRTAGRQLWYGIFSPGRHESAVPFACTLAGLLGERKKVLLVLFTQFCGISGLLNLENTCDTERFYLELRNKCRKKADGLSMPQTIALEGFELLPEPKNPAVLYELCAEEVHAMTERLVNSDYDAVLWLADGVFQGMEYPAAQSRLLLSVEKTDTASICRQEEFHAYGRRLPGAEWEEKIRRIRLPLFARMDCGEHLLWQWKESALREEAQKWMEETTGYGS